ncbi:polysaccharide biosynthesis tyrosine autokinase [bacterium]|nr:polysaccharide biosynthesis tyrosine autokinase [bacterium]RQV99141.1 MAG: polysaccharide biosynthesis tyrosine autokinase [bacterium]
MKEQQVTLSDYVRVLYRGRWIILFSFLIVVASTAYFTFTAQPVYEASALILLKEEGRVQQQIFEVTSLMQRETSINNHVEILKSRTLAENVILQLQESSQADSLYILGYSPGGEKFSIQRWLISLISRDGSGTRKPSEAELFEEYVRAFRSVIEVVPRRDTDLIELKFQAPTPFEASFVANTWMEAYRDLDIRESREEVSEVRQFLEDKLKDVEAELTASEDALKEYKETQNVAELTAETQQLIEQAAEFETLYQEAKTDLEANEKRLDYLKNQLGENQKALVDDATTLSSPVIAELEKQLAEQISRQASLEQQIRYYDLSSEYGNLPELEQRIKGIQDKIIEEKKNIVASGGAAINPLLLSETLLTNILEIETENTSLKSKSDALWGILQEYNRNLDRLPEKSLVLARLQREATVNENIFMMLSEKYEENRIAEAGQIGSVRIVDRALPPDDPVSPKKKMNLLLGILVGLGLGVGLTFIREYLDTSLKTIEDIERLGFPVLGSIPFIASQRIETHTKKLNGEIQRIESRLITHFAPKSPISEAYRTLRTNIQYTKIDRPIRTVLVTSSNPGEGKSTSVANIAITFAQMGAKTLLVDTDLRRPVLHAIFNHPRTEGLTNVLVGNIDLNKGIRPTHIDNLSLLCSGTLPPNPSELLASDAMEKLLEKASAQFDILLFDSPPVIAVTDAAVLATKLDGVVLVIKSGETNKDAILRSRVLLENVNAKIFGILVNGVNIDNMYGSTYYYYQYYYYGDGKHKKKKGLKSFISK